VDWPLAGVFIAGGAMGGFFGSRLATHLSSRKGTLNMVLAVLIIVVAVYMLYRTVSSMGLF
jgi:uncharacterized membrane protein YfcA